MKADDIWQAMFNLAPARFAPYLSVSDVDKLDAIARHEYNLALAAALTSLLNLVEIGVRNAIHNALVATHGRSDWYDVHGFLLQNNRAPIDDVRRVAAAKFQLAQNRKPVVPDNVVSVLTFGFWPGLFIRFYDRKVALPVINTQALLLPSAMRNRGAIEQRLRNLSRIRNRIAHHEPIWATPTLAQDYQMILEAVRWLPPDFSRLAQLQDKFPHLYRGGVRAQRLELAELLNHGEDMAFDPKI